jgi:hypothetical protein
MPIDKTPSTHNNDFDYSKYKAMAHEIRVCLVVAFLLLFAGALRAQTQPTSKDRFHLFNPTPSQMMREISADRPDVTESAYTVDAGHVQLEMSFIDYSYEDQDGTRTNAFTFAPFNLKVGLLNNMDVQLVVEPYAHIEVENGDDETLTGFGDMQLRLKINIWGNDAGNTALAVMPFVVFPTGSDDLSSEQVEGGIIFPFAMNLPGEFTLGLMVEFDFVYDEEDDDYTTDFVYTAALGHDLVGELAGYAEYIGVAPLDGDSDYQALVGSGLTYGLSENVQLDVGVVVGLTDDADDFNAFTGITIRR